MIRPHIPPMISYLPGGTPLWMGA